MDFNFARLDLFVAGSADESPADPARPTHQAIAQVSQTLHRALLNSPEQMRCEIHLEGATSLKLTWIGAGQTAGIAYWFRNQRVEAVSLLLSGIDPVEDLAAIQLLMSAVPGSLPKPAIDSILQSPRPLLTCLYRATESLQDIAISTAAVALAVAFFGMLGLNYESESRSC